MKEIFFTRVRNFVFERNVFEQLPLVVYVLVLQILGGLQERLLKASLVFNPPYDLSVMLNSYFTKAHRLANPSEDSKSAFELKWGTRRQRHTQADLDAFVKDLHDSIYLRVLNAMRSRYEDVTGPRLVKYSQIFDFRNLPEEKDITTFNSDVLRPATEWLYAFGSNLSALKFNPATKALDQVVIIAAFIHSSQIAQSRQDTRDRNQKLEFWDIHNFLLVQISLLKFAFHTFQAPGSCKIFLGKTGGKRKISTLTYFFERNKLKTTFLENVKMQHHRCRIVAS